MPRYQVFVAWFAENPGAGNGVGTGVVRWPAKGVCEVEADNEKIASNKAYAAFKASGDKPSGDPATLARLRHLAAKARAEKRDTFAELRGTWHVRGPGDQKFDEVHVDEQIVPLWTEE